MKTERLYAITVYLLNHGKTSSAELAEKFEVSVRTVQRDIDTLCKAGIPIAAQTGASGGYFLVDTFRMDGQIATRKDYSFILTALKGLSSAMNDSKIDATLEKLSAIAKDDDESIILDFSVLREGDEKLLKLFRSAIHSRHPVRFTYTNADSETRVHTVEPIAVVYRWYAWYLLAYSTVKQDYRTYKLVRMKDAEILDAPFTKEHDSAAKILKEQDKNEPQAVTAVTVRCKPEARAKAMEYLNGKIIREHENGECEMTLSVMEKEHFWFGALLSLGDGIEIIEPERIRVRVLNAAKKIVSMYEKTMT
jgi:predicted DNA-binding transcriptional regulator YafY